jgi:predicted transcriptional regulator
MSALPLFREDGDPYVDIPMDLITLDTDLRSSAIEVAAFLAAHHQEGRLDQTLTDKDIAKAIHRSVGFVQKGLHTLERCGYCQRLGRGSLRRIRLRFHVPDGLEATP